MWACKSGNLLLDGAPSFISPRFIFPLTKASFHSWHSFRAHSPTEKQVGSCVALLLTSVASLIGVFIIRLSSAKILHDSVTLASPWSWQRTRQIKIKPDLLRDLTEVLISEITCSPNRHFLFKPVRGKLACQLRQDLSMPKLKFELVCDWEGGNKCKPTVNTPFVW